MASRTGNTGFRPRWHLKAAVLAVLLSACAPDAEAQHISPALEARLSPAQQRTYLLHVHAREVFDRQLNVYWAEVNRAREERREKRRLHEPFTAADYIAEQPPKYTGPNLSPDIVKVIEALKQREPEANKPMPGVADFLAHAKSIYGFEPTPSSEREFKRHYAENALAAGLTKMQVVRVYALETGGRGTYDMQAGIDPDSKQGQPISSALGYAQLLNANSVDELVQHGSMFIERLNAMAAHERANPRRAAVLKSKVVAIGRMLRVARSVPREWSHHVALARTPRGLGIHALNLDADIGPWLQVVKLKGILETAVKAGRPHLSGAELELMNLAGPGTGLEMMQPVARNVPTSNFFSRTGYYRNSIVRDRTAAELIDALEERMEAGIRKPGSLEFIAVFDEVMKQQRSAAR